MLVPSMKTTIRRLGNSRGILIPKPFLVQVGLEQGAAELTVEGDAIVLRRARPEVRAGWAEACQSLSLAGDDALVWPEFGNSGDEDLAW